MERWRKSWEQGKKEYQEKGEKVGRRVKQIESCYVI